MGREKGGRGGQAVRNKGAGLDRLRFAWLGLDWRRFDWLLVAVVGVLLVAVAALRPQFVFEPPWLLPPLNLIFLTLVPFFTAAFAVRAYLATGVTSVLAVGAGMVAIGCSGMVSAMALHSHGANAAVTIYNLAFLLAGALQLAGSLAALLGAPAATPRPWHVAGAYGAVVAASFVILALTLMQTLPPFFVPGAGQTAARRIVLAAAFESFVFSAVIWWQVYLANRSVAFLRWYVLGLALFALGVGGNFLAAAVGDMVSWSARVAHVLGSLYVLVAVLRVRGVEELGASMAQGSVSYRPLLESTSEAVAALSRRGHILYWNAAARDMFGAESQEVFGKPLLEAVRLGGGADAGARERLEALLSGADARGRLEAPLMDMNGRDFAAEVAVYASRLDPRNVVCVIRDVSERKRLETERIEAAVSVAELSRRVVNIEEEERRRLARELHDRTSGNLSALALNLDTIVGYLPGERPEELEACVADTAALLDDTITNIREVTSELHPALLDHVGLLAALRNYAGQFTRRTGIAVRVSGPPAEPRLAYEREAALFRITQEALTNCAKHARASAVTVTVEEQPGRIVLAIADNGAGFDPGLLADGRHTPGLGLLTMRERAQFAGGSFRLESQPGRGTRISVELPQ